jgi:hypothetical protein
LPAPRGFSQATTSFIASYRLGIHRMRFVHLTRYNPKRHVEAATSGNMLYDWRYPRAAFFRYAQLLRVFDASHFPFF